MLNPAYSRFGQNRRRSGNRCSRYQDRGFKLPFAPLIGRGSQYGAKQLWPVRHSPTRPQKVIYFEELLSELNKMARKLRPHLSSRLVSALLTYVVRQRTLSSEERCGRRLLT